MPPVRYIFFPTTFSQSRWIGLEIFGVAGQRRDVGHAREHIGGPHGMADGLVLLEDGLVGLDLLGVVVDGEAVSRRILGELDVVAALVEEILGQVEIFLVPRHAIELDQGQLDLLVAGKAVPLVRAEDAAARDRRS